MPRRFRARLFLAVLLGGLLAVPASAVAASGALDSTFGKGGVSSLASGTELRAVAIQSDGQIVATGDAGSSLLVERFSANGSREAAFAAGSGVGRGIAVQSDGKIVVAGNDAAGMLVERFNSGGTLDAGFGSGGKVHAFPGGRANAVALGPSGTIIAVGQVTAGDGFQRVAVLRLNSNGTGDASIGSGGQHLVDLGQDSIANSVAVQGDGKIVIAGSIGPGTHQVRAGFATRLASDGTIDPGFLSGGLFISGAQRGGADAVLNAVALDPAGGIVVAGGSTSANQSEAVLARLTCSGNLDPSFGGGIKLAASSSAFVTDPLGANAVVVAAGSRVVGAGEFRESGLTSASLWGFEAGGAPDFATIAPSAAQSTAIALDAAGNLVVAGSNLPTGFAPSGFVARYIGFGGPATGTTPCGGSPPPPPPPPPPPAPSVTTGPASAVTSSTASLSGSVNPNGAATSYHFDYGKSPIYGSQTAVVPAGSGTANIGASATLSQLASRTTYHYRLVASSSSGTAYGADMTFTTSSPPPPPRPVVSNLSQTNRIWAETKSRTYKRVPVGTTFSFTLNIDARVHFTFTQQVSGRMVNGKCVAKTKKNHTKPACTRTATKGRLSFAGYAGKNTFPFRGHVSRSNQLQPGTYTLVVTATNAARQMSRPQTLSFTIVS